MKSWLCAALACQDCGETLTVDQRFEESRGELLVGTVHCGECEFAWPVLGGVPFLLTDPGAYLSGYRESVLATLAEFDMASPPALQLINTFSEGHRAEPMRYGDDWTRAELNGEVAADIDVQSEAMDTFRRLLEQERQSGLANMVSTMLGAGRWDTLIEVGPGAGGLTQSLAARCNQLILIDFSLRSLLHAQAKGCGNTSIGAILGDVNDLEMPGDCACALVAANVVDLLNAPETSLLNMSRWLCRGGTMLLSTPEPSLGGDSDDALADILDSLDYTIEERRDGIPWFRHHSGRYWQLYWLQALRVTVQ